MITIKGLMRQKNKPVGEQYYLVVENCKFDGNNVWIYEEDLLALLEKLIKVMNSPTMRNVDYSELYKLSNKLQKKLQEKCEVQDKDNKGGSCRGGIREFGNNLIEAGSNAVEVGLGVIKNIGNPKKTEIEQKPETMVEPSDEEREEAKREMAELEERWRQEEQKKEEQRCKARDAWFQAERELAEEKARYSKAKRIEQIYNGKVQPMLQPFLKLMESLIYFAGCLNAENFSTRKRVLRNRQRIICGILQSSTWDFSLDREAFQGIDEMLAAMDQEAKLPELPQLSEQLTTDMYLQKKQATEELKRKYILENEILRLKDVQQRKVLEYICLFRGLYSVIEKICAACESEIEEQWAISIGQEIVQIVDCYQSRNTNMKFAFVYPDDNTSAQSESVKIDFIAAEADSPGLYYRDSSTGELLCVIPGRVK